MDSLPAYIYWVFGCTVVAALFIFYKASNQSKPFLLILVGWVAIQTTISLSGFYTTLNTMPPRISLLLLPPLVAMIVLFTTNRGKQFIDELSLPTLTLFHIIRIPVELVLFWLFVHKAVPQLMTFEGRNFDIVSGLTAPLLYYVVFVKRKPGKTFLLGWNVVCLGLLINIVVNAILSVPTPFQQFAFDQPNVGILQFPFTLLPAVLVPLVLLAHLAAIRQLLLNKS